MHRLRPLFLEKQRNLLFIKLIVHCPFYKTKTKKRRLNLRFSLERIMFWAFIIGNILYYTAGIILAFFFKDNRAFCKYICPITVFLKPMSYFSLIRLKCDKEKCVSCGKCKRVCPMNVDVTDNSRKRKNGTECILCMECVKNCPKDAL